MQGAMDSPSNTSSSTIRRRRRDRTPEPPRHREGVGISAEEAKSSSDEFLQHREEIARHFEVEEAKKSATATNGEKKADDEENDDDFDSKSVLDGPSPGNIQEEGFIDAFYQPRTVSGLMLLVALVVYLTIWKENEVFGKANRLKRGLLLSALAFLLYSVIQLRDGQLLRPHPAVWRIVHGTGLLYFMILVFLLAQDLEGITSFLRLFDDSVGRPEHEHSYGEDCRLYAADQPNPFQNIENQIFDRFVIAHAAGYALKALILRDWMLVWIVSVLFEVLEVTFQHMYPNFNECWWDHLILDVFGCNLVGMIVGMKLVQYMGTHHFNWTGRRVETIHGYFGKMQRVALQFTPRTFESYDWHVFQSWRRFAVAVSVVFILLLGELNGFFIKSTFHIPIKSHINLYRLFFWVFMTYMATFELHRYAEGKSRRIGVNSWLGGSLVILETLLVVKHTVKQRLFEGKEIMPAGYIVRGWSAALALAVLLALVKIARKAVVHFSGAEQLIDHGTENIVLRDDATLAEIRQQKLRSASLDSIEAAVPGSSAYIRIERILTKVAQTITFLLPLPLIVVLMIDCYRTLAFHPPPTPGVSPNW